MGVSLDVSRGHHMNGLLVDLHDQHSGVTTYDHLMDDGHRDVLVGHRTNVTDDRNDLKMGGTTDVSRGHRMNYPLVYRKTDANLYRHTNGRLDDLNLDVNRVNRNCALRDRKMGENSDVKNLHVKYY